MKRKLFVLQNHVIQYFSPLYKSIAERGDADIVVVYLSDNGLKEYYDGGFGQKLAWDVDLLSGYRSIFLTPREAGQIARGLSACKLLRNERPDWILIYGYNKIENWIVVFLAKICGIKVAYFADSNARIRRPLLKELVKHIVVRLFFACLDVIFYTAEANRDYARRYGASQRQLKYCPFGIETKRFDADRQSRPSGERYDFAWAGKLDKRKRAGDFLQALTMLRRDGLDFKAVIAGAGEDAEFLRTAGESLFREGRLEYVGFLNQSEMPALLAKSDVFVFTSEYDSYGLAATEAAASACALIVTDCSGCVGELGPARPGANALVYKPGDIRSLHAHMKRLLTDEALKRKMQAESKRIAAFSDVACAAGAIEKVVGSHLTSSTGGWLSHPSGGPRNA